MEMDNAVSEEVPIFGVEGIVESTETSLSRHEVDMLIAAHYALQVADAATTSAGIRRGGIEVMPLMRQVADSPARLMGTKLGVATLFGYLAKRLSRKDENSARAVLWVANGIYGAAVINNLYQLWKLKR